MQSLVNKHELILKEDNAVTVLLIEKRVLKRSIKSENAVFNISMNRQVDIDIEQQNHRCQHGNNHYFTHNFSHALR